MLHLKKADIVVIGGGASGTMAAIHANRANPALKVVMLDKSRLETSGAAGRGMDAINTIVLPPYCQPEDFVAMQTKITEGVLDQEVSYAYAELGPQLVMELEQIMGRAKGDLFPVDDTGNYHLRYVQPVNKPMMLYMDGADLKRSLAKAARATGAEIHDRTPALKILTEGGRVLGVLGFNIRTGDYVFIRAKAVCLTAGPAGRMGLASSGYLSNTYEFPGNSGDGYALAYEAGAELVNMECYQALTMLKDFQGPACGFVAGTRGATSSNRVGETIWTHPYPSGDTRLGTWRTFAEGKGPIYLHTHHLQEEIIRIIEHIQFGTERTGRFLFHKRRGQDYRQPRCLELAFAEEIGACGGHSSSGVNSNRRGETNVRGLYVAGDVDAGLPYSFLGGALAMGGVIGEEAARYAAGSDWAGGNPRPWAREEIHEFEAPLRRKRGLPTHLVEFKARTRLQYYLKPPKNPDYHEIALWWMERIRKQDLPEVKAEDPHDLLKAHELRSILTVGEMMARSSLFRNESRWGYQHWRVDIPEKKTGWNGTWVSIRRGDRGMVFEKKKVPPYRWNFPTAMEYSYPTLSFDLGVPFQKDSSYNNPLGDPWTKGRMERARGESKKSRQTRKRTKS
jgi:succinate dehydrogenase/fumarate reductase flavoprotein subunit